LSLFSITIGLGASFALVRLALASDESTRQKALLLGLLVQSGALAAARMAFVLAHLTYFSTRQNEILNVTTGGFWWPGAVIGGLFMIVVIGLVQQNQVRQALDRFRVFLLPMTVSFWLASWSAGVAYGARLDPSVWWGIPILDINGVTLPRVPVQPAAALTLLLILGAFERGVKKQLPVGRRMGILLLATGVHTLLFSLVRDDPVKPVFGIRLDVWASILLILVAAILIAFTFEVKSRKSKTQKEFIE
jgi:prolipoprotein diacylglyceryltransferase